MNGEAGSIPLGFLVEETEVGRASPEVLAP